MEENTLNSKNIGVRIKSLREEIGLTQKELAQKLGLSGETAITNYESGYSIPKDEIKYKLCKLFNCSMDYLLCLSDERESIDTSKIRIGLSANDYTEITETQRKQIEEFAKFVLKDNEKKNKNNK
ncbi:MAG: helix-turn-helix transcriptional regulator [Clostridia bacterium]|nr:helix-turn-helix transcriptional regulator [Clostridia bacterium]